MRVQRFIQGVLAVLVVLGCFAISLSLLPRTAKAQIDPFLITPYYGNKTRTSYFDHKYPTYNSWPNTTYGNIVIYTGNDGSSCNPYCYNGHAGIDFSATYEPIIAAAGGYVTAARWNNENDRSAGLGVFVEIQHGNNYRTLYGHLSSVAVNVGQYVHAGQIIGASGNTGSSTAAHLHFEVRSAANTVVDPFGWTGGYTDPWQTHSGATSYCLWKDGEWANLCGGVSRPIPAPHSGGEILIDLYFPVFVSR